MSEIAQQGFSRASQYWLLLALLLVILPHTVRLPVWVIAYCACLIAWRVVSVQKSLPQIPRWMMAVITVASATLVYLQFGTLLGKNVGVTLLVLMLCLKLLELRAVRDVMVMVFLSYFLVITNFLYSQSMLMAIYMFLVVWLITATLVELNFFTSHNKHPWRNLKIAGKLLAQSVPLMLVMFVLFPRVAGPFWGLPVDAHNGISGLSNTMNLGSISDLIESEEVVFRVSFEQKVPLPEQRYWRGPVFWFTNGKTWTRGDTPVRSVQHNQSDTLETFGAPIIQKVIQEPHNANSLYTLDIATSVSIAAHQANEFQWVAQQKITSPTVYTAVSYPTYNMKNLTALEARNGLQTSGRVTRRMRALVQRWQNNSAEPSEVVQQALSMFRNEPYIYTLSPPILGTRPVDEFLFETRKGFCEHYAAAFTTLMRVAGIPARVVTGYQGGEFNPIGNFIIVRQSNAHAWSEVWLGDKGWVRVDPTAAVAPQRIEYNIDLFAQNPGDPVRFLDFSDNALLKSFRAMRHSYDSILFNWNQWVLGYGPEKQQQLIKDWGLEKVDWQTLTLLLIIVIGIIVTIIYIVMLSGNNKPVDPILQIYHRFLAKLTRVGVAQQRGEGPLDFSSRVAQYCPQIANDVKQICALYIGLRYKPKINDSVFERRLHQFKVQVKQFNPNKPGSAKP